MEEKRNEEKREEILSQADDDKISADIEKEMTPPADAAGGAEKKTANSAQIPEEEMPEAQTDASAKQTDVPAEQTTENVVSASAPDWTFGGSVSVKKEKTSGQKQFFLMFGVIFGICLLLLALTMFLGNGGIQLVRNITKERIIYVRNDDGSSGLLTPQEAADKVGKSTVTVSVTTKLGSGIGSGFIYSADGYVCTNYHVIQSAETVQVILADGKAYDAVVRGYNEDADIAVLKIDAKGLVPAELGISEDLLVGDAVVAVGTPAKLDYAGTSTFGTVSATNRLVAMTDSNTGSIVKKMTLIQTDTSVNPGNSGGPLADMYGKVVGVVVMKVSTYGGSDFEGIGFALPIDGVKTIVDEIIQKGSFTGRNPIVEGRSLLGVTGHGGSEGVWYRVDPETGVVESSEEAKPGYHRMLASGIYVMEISGANARDKVNTGDVITQVNGLNVVTTSDLIAAVNRYYAGETVTLTLRRGAATLYVEIVLQEESAS